MPEPSEDYLDLAELACHRLDGIQEYGIATGNAGGLLVLHGLATYARDTARAAMTLLRDGQTLGAAALTRVVIEHAVLAQWLVVDPETRGGLFLQQSQVERARWFEVVLAANTDREDPFHVAMAEKEKREGLVGKPKNVTPDFDTVRNLFGDTERGRQLYLTYRNLSRFVHPSAATFAMYTSKLPGGLQLPMQRQVDWNGESLSFFLAAATVMSVLPYLDVLGEVGAAATVMVAAQSAGVPTSLTDA